MGIDLSLALYLSTGTISNGAKLDLHGCLEFNDGNREYGKLADTYGGTNGLEWTAVPHYHVRDPSLALHIVNKEST